MLDISAPARLTRPPLSPCPDSRGAVVGRIQKRAFVDRDPRWALYRADGSLSNTFAADLDRDGVAALLAESGLTLKADNTVVDRTAPPPVREIVCHAAQLGRDMERAAAEWDRSMDRYDAAPRGPEGQAIRDREDDLSRETTDALFRCIDAMPGRQAITMEGALAQIIVASEFLSRLDTFAPSAELSKEVHDNVHRILRSLSHFMVGKLGGQPFPHAYQQMLLKGCIENGVPVQTVGLA